MSAPAVANKAIFPKIIHSYDSSQNVGIEDAAQIPLDDAIVRSCERPPWHTLSFAGSEIVRRHTSLAQSLW